MENRIDLPNIKIFKGVWLIKKIKNKDNEYYLEIIKDLINKGFEKGGIIDSNKNGENYLFSVMNNRYFYMSNIGNIILFNEPERKIKIKKYNYENKISAEFSFFSSFFDKRWEDIPYPPSLLYLAGKTIKKGIKSSVSIIDKESKNYKIPEADFWGFTLFDDFLPEILEFFNEIRERYRGKIGAGGPLVTLSPLTIIAHIHNINFFLRGEADNAITDIIRVMSGFKKNDIFSIFNEISKFQGFYYNDEDYFILSNIDKINRVSDIDSLEIDFSIVPDKKIEKGIELNLSRGCPRACIFCSHVHGRKFRMVSPEKTKRILKDYKNEVRKRKIEGNQIYNININDDDILLGEEKMYEIIDIIKKEGFKIYGFQTSVSSFVNGKGINYEMLDYIADKGIYVSKPLLWIGTDTFLEKRGKRLGKQYLKREIFELLLNEFQKREILNYHYWIILDGDSSWKEFIYEFFYIWGISNKFKNFNLLPTSSYLIPYPYSAAYMKDLKRKNSRIIIKKILKSRTGEYDYPIVEREEPEDEFLSRAVSPVFEYKTIEYLKRGDYFNAFQRIYPYIKKARFYLRMREEERYNFLNEIDGKVEKLTEN
jgi:radical SAM superfamily enzyme YgiQ (UPF0313 family)